MSKEVAEIVLISRDLQTLEQLKKELIIKGATSQLTTSTNMADLQNAQLVLTVTSSVGAVIEPSFLAPGSVICDVARPSDVAVQVKAARDDVLVIDGGIIEVPGPVEFHFNFGLPPGKTFACMAETIALTLEGRFEDYTIGKNIAAE